MKTDENKLKKITQENPFRVPEGYLEGLTSRIMKQIPAVEEPEAEPISWVERLRPFIYLAAMFAGLGLFFRAVTFLSNTDDAMIADTLLVSSETPELSLGIIWDEGLSDDDEEYLDYLENQYTAALIQDELDSEP